MCGVFGFIAKDGGKLNLTTLSKIAIETETRGPHAWGMAWINRDGRMFMFKQTGPISDDLGLLAMARDAVLLIGHTRWATQGSPSNNLNNHPHPCDGGWIVHNGMIPSYRQIIRDYRLHPVTDCDSEVLGLLVENLPQEDLLERCVEATRIGGERDLVMLGLWKPGQLVAVRKGNPLHYGETSNGYYLGSLPYGLPHPKVVPNGQGLLFESGSAGSNGSPLLDIAKV